MTRLTFPIWRALRAACSAALAGGAGGDFTEEDIERIDKANEWLGVVGEQRGFFNRLEVESK